MPDRRGNNRIDTLRNIVNDGRIALMFLIPGITECMRINGQAVLRHGPEVLGLYAVGDKLPATVIEITVEAAYFQCARAVKRADLWNSELHLSRNAVPSPGQIMTAITQGEFDGKAYDDGLQERQAQTMY